MIWTEQRVREELPVIRVKFCDGYESTAQLGGRTQDFALVVVNVHGSTLDTTASWQTIAYALNNGNPLSI